MPRGATPRENQLARLSLLDKQLKDATTPSKLEKVKALLQARTTGYVGKKESEKVKALRRAIRKREASLAKGIARD